jgi:UDP-N-acetylmuramoylalanine--D-glutamate ligase
LADILKIPKKIQKESLENFEAVEGRMQFLGKKKNILFFNDNNSTTPDSTILNIISLKKKYSNKKIYLIGGGADKNFQFKKLSKIIEKNIEFSVLFEGAGTEKIISNFQKKFSFFEKSNSMEFSFNKILEKINNNKKSIIILSPGASSFGVFENEYDRNDQFMKLFKNI